jgi:hypothetical protein
MTFRAPDPGFFVGYFKKVPPAIRTLMLVFGVFLVAGLASASILLTLAARSPGPGNYVDELHGGHLTGVLETRPYPILRVPATAETPARAIMLSGAGKFGVDDIADPLSGKLVDAGSVIVKRGDLDMLLADGPATLHAAANVTGNAAAPATAEPLGHWRLTGEICDGKCYSGAMRPGGELAHKACANLCISGHVPPVFVSTAPVDGHIFFVLADADGGPMPAALKDRTAVRIQLDGVVERRDNLLIFKVDPSSVRADK